MDQHSFFLDLKLGNYFVQNKDIADQVIDLLMITKYLEKIGSQILIRNFRSYYGEIDIIVKDKNEYVFVEVKTRASDKFGKPVEAVDNTKQKHIYKTAEYYLYCKKLENTYIRFDIIEVYKRQEKFYVHHIKNALMF